MVVYFRGSKGCLEMENVVLWCLEESSLLSLWGEWPN